MQQYMRLALALAQRGQGKVHPNPMVGAVLVKNGQVIGQGYHEQYGGPHAERNALKHCTQDPAGSTLYVTLEPCCHTGKTPPCTEAIIQSKIARVVIGSRDPNPQVSGKGIERLRAQGITVEVGMLENECNALNTVFFHYIQTGMPYVTLKYAMTLDGKIAAADGTPRSITGTQARAHLHRTRARNAAILIGIGTALADNPLLTCRNGGASPIRVVCDTQLRLPLTSQLVRTAKQVPLWLATCQTAPQKHKPYEQAGCKILCMPQKNGQVDLTAVLQALGAAGLDSVLIEGGGVIHTAALREKLVQRLQVYIAPMLLGGAKCAVSGAAFAASIPDVTLAQTQLMPLGQDFLWESEVHYDVHRTD